MRSLSLLLPLVLLLPGAGAAVSEDLVSYCEYDGTTVKSCVVRIYDDGECFGAEVLRIDTIWWACIRSGGLA